MRYIKKVISLLFFFNVFFAYSQCEMVKIFEDDLYEYTELREYASKAEDPDKVFDAWRLLLEEKLVSKTNPAILKEVEDNYQAIQNTGGYVKWKAVNGSGSAALDVTTATEKQLDDIFVGLQNSPPFKYTPNTLEHKAERWAQYKIRLGNDAKDYSAWSNTYNANMTKATKAHQATDEIMASIGWGQREVTVQAGIYTRRMDIADKVVRKGVEVKSYETGKVYATQIIIGELNADKFLINNDLWQIEWVFKSCEPSQPLRTLLEEAGITIKLVP
jgi:hypothetical protein